MDWQRVGQGDSYNTPKTLFYVALSEDYQYTLTYDMMWINQYTLTYDMMWINQYTLTYDMMLINQYTLTYDMMWINQYTLTYDMMWIKGWRGLWYSRVIIFLSVHCLINNLLKPTQGKLCVSNCPPNVRLKSVNKAHQISVLKRGYCTTWRRVFCEQFIATLCYFLFDCLIHYFIF